MHARPHVRRIAVGGYLASAVLVAGCTAGSEPNGSGAEGSGSATGAGRSEAADPTDLPALEDPLVVGLGPVCEQEAVVAETMQYPDAVDQMQALTFLEVMNFPNTPAMLRNEYVPVGMNAEWAVPPEVIDYGRMNAFVCFTVVEGTEYVRIDDCEGTTADGGNGTWEVWGSDLQIRIIEPSTGRLIAEDDPFPSTEIYSDAVLDCGVPPSDLSDGEHGYAHDGSTPGVMQRFIDDFIATLG